MQVSEVVNQVRALRPHQAGPGYHVPMTLLLAGLVLMAVFMAIRVALGAFDVFVRDAAMTFDPSPVTVALGGTEIAVAGNMVRYASQRGGAQQKLNLFLHWPSLEGYTIARAEEFQPGHDESVVYVTLTPAAGAMSPEARFHALYPRVLADETRDAAGGLVVRPFRDGFGYDGEELYIAPRAESPLSARCQPRDAAGATCMVEYRTGFGIDIMYRFRRHLLAEWRDLDLAIRAMVRGMVVGGASG